ncbi:MAG: DUF5715 family protein [Gemmatimonadota bacterium]
MRRSIPAIITVCVLIGGTAACQPEETEPATQQIDAPAVEPPPPPLDPARVPEVQAALEARVTEVEAAVQRLPGLIGSIRRDMRRYVNADHVAAAQRNGVGPVRDSTHVAALVQSGALVELPDSTRWWVLRELNQSLPYVTPGTKAALEEIGRRFHARLQERGLPAFRLDVTSVLRTGAQQAALRRRNRNASSTTSSHEFGTTFDIAYLSFAAPQSLDDAASQQALPEGVAAAQIRGELRAAAMVRLDTLGTRHAPHIEGELGAVLQEMQREGSIMTLRERSQPVFHTTVVK